MKKIIFLFFFSLLIVGLGQPQTSQVLSLLSSGLGFGLFWVTLFRVKKRFLYSVLWFSCVQLIQLSWLASTTYQGFYILGVYVALAFCLGLQFGVLSLFFPKNPPLAFTRCLGIAGAWTLIEWSRLYVLCGFAWNPIGLSHTAYASGSQIASICGILGLSFLVVFVNLLAVNAFFIRDKKTICIWGGFLLFPYVFGWAHLHYHDCQRSDSSSPLNVVLIQTALLPDQKMYFHERREQFISPYEQWENILLSLEVHRSQGVDLIVLPESALPFSAYTPVYAYEEVKRITERVWGDIDLSSLLITPFMEMREGRCYVNNAFWSQVIANQYGAEFVIGLDDSDEECHYNAAFHFVPHDLKISRYEKRILLPLAEYLPFKFLQPLVACYGIQDFFTHGKEAKVIEGKYPLSLSICYEECFSHLIREGRQRGAKLLVNVTNDAWYPFSTLPKQHFDHGRIRAIENGVPLLRACNTGITAGVDSLGRTVGRFGTDRENFELERGALFLSLDLYTFPTLYTAWGDRFILVFSIVCLAFLAKKRENPLAENKISD